MPIVVHPQSREYIHVPITADVALGTQPVQVAVLPTADQEIAEADWWTAEWTPTGARVLIGPGSLHVLPVGAHWVHVRVDDGTERVVLFAGRLPIGYAA